MHQWVQCTGGCRAPVGAEHWDRRLQPQVSACGRGKDEGNQANCSQTRTKLLPDAPCPPCAGPCLLSWSPRTPSAAPNSLCSPQLQADPPSGMAGSVSSPHPHFPIQDIWVGGAKRRLICPLIPQPGGVRLHGGPEPLRVSLGWGLGLRTRPGGPGMSGGFPHICHHLITNEAPQQRSLCAPQLSPARLLHPAPAPRNPAQTQDGAAPTPMASPGSL